MLAPLFLPSLNVSASPNASVGPLDVSSPALPDMWKCNKFYAIDGPADIEDCYQAIINLPYSSDPVPFYINPQTAEESRSSLPTILRKS